MKFICVLIIIALLTACFVGCGQKSAEDLVIAEDFIQPWYCKDWSVTQWETHLIKLKNLGYTTIILQATAEVENGKLKYIYFIDKDIECEQSSTIENLMESCRNVGFKARLGLINDDAWWNEINETKVNNWIYINSVISQSIYNKFYEQYIDEFAGMYWSFEMYTQNEGYENLWAELMNKQIEIMNNFECDISLMFSPFYSTYYNLSKKECLLMWENFFKVCNFREYDIFAPQDGYGGGEANATTAIDKRVNSHLQTASKACSAYSKAQFYVNIELFTNQNSVYATCERINHQKELAAKNNAKGLISFSYSHYFI